MTTETPPSNLTEIPANPSELGSEPLPIAKHEIFCNRVAVGVSQLDAYEAAGYSRVSSSATRLAQRPDIQARIAFLREQIARALTFDATWIKERMGALADALTEIQIDPKTGLRKPGPMFNAHAGARVLELLGREQGIFKDRIELGGQVAVGNTDMLRNMKPEERGLMKEMLLNVLNRPPQPANDDATQVEKPKPTGVVPIAK